MSSLPSNNRAVSIIKKLLLTVGITFLFFVCFLVFSMRGAIWGIPYDVKTNPVLLSNNSFHTEFEVSCNRFYAREVGFIIDPPIAIDRISGADLKMRGNVKLVIKQGNMKVEKSIVLSGRNSRIDGAKGIWMQLIFRYPPLDGFFCSDQLITIDAKDISFNLNEHQIEVYVSRDRRP